jgi:hypothetical protein
MLIESNIYSRHRDGHTKRHKRRHTHPEEKDLPQRQRVRPPLFDMAIVYVEFINYAEIYIT